MKSEWTPSELGRKVTGFAHKNQQEVIHVIKTGFENIYIVVHEDCHEIKIGKTFVGSKEEVEHQYNIKI